MILNKMIYGSYGEKYRFQFTTLFRFLFLSILFMVTGILSFLFYPVMLIICESVIIIWAIALLLYTEILLLYDNCFIVTRLTRPEKRFQQLQYDSLIEVYVNIRLVRGNNYYSFYYINRNNKRCGGVSYKVTGIDKTIAPLIFLYSKGIKIHINDETFAKHIFGVKEGELKKEVVNKQSWYVG